MILPFTTLNFLNMILLATSCTITIKTLWAKSIVCIDMTTSISCSQKMTTPTPSIPSIMDPISVPTSIIVHSQTLISTGRTHYKYVEHHWECHSCDDRYDLGHLDL